MKTVMKIRPEKEVEIREIPRPVRPRNYPKGEVIVKIGGCGVCETDIGVYNCRISRSVLVHSMELN